MSESSICRLCLDACSKYKSLYDENGRANQLYEMTYQYFHQTIVNMDQAKHLTIVCVRCWRHMRDFHNFKLSILVAQAQLSEHVAEEEVDVKIETEEIANPIGHFTIVCLENEDNVDQFSLSTVKTEATSNNDELTDDSQIKQEAKDEPIEIVEFSDPTSDGNDNDDIDNKFSLNLVKTEADNLTDEPQAGDDPIDTIVNDTTEAKDENLFITLPELELIDVHDDNKDDLNLNDEPTMTYESSEADAFGAGPATSTADLGGESESVNQVKHKFLKTYSMLQKKRLQKLDNAITKSGTSIKCIQCTETFKSYLMYREHFHDHHHKEVFYIACCNLKLTGFDRIQDHFMLHKDPTAFDCKKCNIRLKSRKSQKKHLAAYHSLKYATKHVCKICRRCCKTEDILHEHYKKHGISIRRKREVKAAAPPTGYKCADCDYIAYTKTAFRRHNCKLQKCLFCNRTFSVLRTLRNHIATHKGKVVYTCSLCPEMFSNYSEFCLHRKDMHDYEETDQQAGENIV